MSTWTLVSWFARIPHPPTKVVIRTPVTTIICDATCLTHDVVLLVVFDSDTNMPLAWTPTPRESFASWHDLLAHLPQTPRYVVADGHKGLITALLARWPGIQLQRCIIHVIRACTAKLTQHPKLVAGQELRRIVLALATIRARRQRRKWIRRFRCWEQRRQNFLNEKTVTVDGHWRYTHRSVRRAHIHLVRAIPDLFRFVGHPMVPRTSNKLEGGVNGPLKDLLRKHRGLNTNMKIILASFYLHKRAKKPTRNLY